MTISMLPEAACCGLPATGPPVLVVEGPLRRRRTADYPVEVFRTSPPWYVSGKRPGIRSRVRRRPSRSGCKVP